MRDILFRGKNASTGTWVHGALVRMPDGISGFAIAGDHFQLPSCDGIGTEDYCEVLNDTICQYIGIKDDKDMPIYEGDIIQHRNGVCYEIKYLDRYARFAATKPGSVSAAFDLRQTRVVGNIFDNQELLKNEWETMPKQDGV